MCLLKINSMYFCNFANLISYERLRELLGMKHSFYYVCLGFEDFKTLKYFISCSCLQLIIKNLLNSGSVKMIFEDVEI